MIRRFFVKTCIIGLLLIYAPSAWAWIEVQVTPDPDILCICAEQGKIKPEEATVTVDVLKPAPDLSGLIPAEGAKVTITMTHSELSGEVLHEERTAGTDGRVVLDYDTGVFKNKPGFVNIIANAEAEMTICGETCETFMATGTGAAAVTIIGVIIKQDGNDITDTTHNEIIGKKINLVGEVEPAGLTITSKQWTIPGTRIKNYSATTISTTLEQLSADDLDNSSVNYYWVDGADSREVKYSVVIDGKKVEGKATFNVKRPTSTMTSSTGSVEVSEVLGQLELHYGNPSTPGILCSRTIEVPSGFSGNTQYRNVLNSTLYRRQKNDGDWQRLSGGNLFDTVQSSNTHQDSPGIPLFNNYKKVTSDDSFTMWLMFNPSGSDAIWVPLRKIDWSWSGSARRNRSGTWTLNRRRNRRNPSSSVTTTFPEWTGSVADFIEEENWEDE